MVVAIQNIPPPPVPARSLLQAARGFSCMVWGVPATLLMMFRPLRMESVLVPRLPLYLLSLLVVGVGFGLLLRAQPLSRPWKTCSGLGLALALLMGYFTPFLLWWHRSPLTPLYVVNMLALLGAAAALLYLVNRLSAEAGRALGDPTLFLEARICAWTSLGVMIPLLSAPLGLALHDSEWMGAQWIVLWLESAQPPPLWALLCFLVPGALSMSSAWKAKERCLLVLVHAAQQPPARR